MLLRFKLRLLFYYCFQTKAVRRQKLLILLIFGLFIRLQHLQISVCVCVPIVTGLTCFLKKFHLTALRHM